MRHNPSQIKIPAIVKAELLLGAQKSKAATRNLERVSEFLAPYEIVSFDDEASQAYAAIRASLETHGEIIGPNDLLIAATVISHSGVLVTNNTREFSRVKQLKIENW